MLKIGPSPYVSAAQYWPGNVGELVCVPVYALGRVVGWGNGEVKEIYTPGHGLPADSNVNDSYIVVHVPTYAPAAYFAHSVSRPLVPGAQQWFDISEVELTNPDPSHPLKPPMVLDKDGNAGKVLPSFDTPQEASQEPLPVPSDAEMLGEALIETADRREWCGEFDEAIDKINRSLHKELPLRKRSFQVTAQVLVYVDVEATDEDQARELAERIFRRAEREIDGIEGLNGNSSWDYSYETEDLSD